MHGRQDAEATGEPFARGLGGDDAVRVHSGHSPAARGDGRLPSGTTRRGLDTVPLTDTSWTEAAESRELTGGWDVRLISGGGPPEGKGGRICGDGRRLTLGGAHSTGSDHLSQNRALDLAGQCRPGTSNCLEE